jgi:hypothetical protein
MELRLHRMKKAAIYVFRSLPRPIPSEHSHGQHFEQAGSRLSR